MRLTTASDYVDAYGVLETGQLLTKKEVIDPTTTDDRSSYVTEMYKSGNESNDLKDDIVTELNRYLDAGQDEIAPRISRYLKWPLQRDGFELQTSEVPDEIGRLVREVARYFLYDESTRSVEEVSFIERRYRNALQEADRIGNGEHDVAGVDTKYEDKTTYVL